MIGKTEEPEEDYDLMEVVIIRRGGKASDEDLFQYLESIFESNLSKMRKYVDIASGSKIEKEVKGMTGMGMSIYERGIEQGIKQGIEQGVEQGKVDSVRKMLKKGYSCEEVADCLEVDIKKVKEMWENLQ